jgi:hypothetical protein
VSAAGLSGKIWVSPTRGKTDIVDDLPQIRAWSDVSFDQFHQEIVPLNQPAHIKSLVGHWPSVQAGNQSSKAIGDYLKNFETGKQVNAAVGDPRLNGRFSYSDDLKGVNFNRSRVTVSEALDTLIHMTGLQDSYAVAIQAIAVKDTLPGFAEANPLPLLDSSIEPTMWFGNRALVAPHYDIHDNIACNVAGARTFTVFPPEQIENLYVGPSLGAPGGVPISTVDLRAPDLERFPRFAGALDSAQRATAEAGDAIYIPALWWHAVESTQDLNVLVNYWWGGLPDNGISPNDSLQHAMLTIATLSEAKREAWKSYFDYYVFRLGIDPTAHLPDGLEDIVTSLSPEQKRMVYALLASHLQ